MQGRERYGAWCFQTSNYAPRSTLKIVHWTISFARYHHHFGHGALRARGVAIPRSSCPEQWYLLRRQRDVTDRELALWPRGGRGVGERGDARWKRGAEKLSRAVQMLFIETHGTSAQVSSDASRFIISHRTRRKCTIISTIDTSLRESSSSSSFSSRVREPLR